MSIPKIFDIKKRRGQHLTTIYWILVQYKYITALKLAIYKNIDNLLLLPIIYVLLSKQTLWDPS